MTAIAKPVAPAVNPLVATDLRPEALIARTANTWNLGAKATGKTQSISCNAAALWILKGEGIDLRDPASRGAAWKVFDDATMEAANEAGRAVASGFLRSALKCVTTLDIDGKYLTPWSVGDFTVGLKEAYLTLKNGGVKPTPTIEKILKSAATKIRKHYPAATATVSMANGEAVLTVTL